ncbi:MAG: hypothetical protein ACPL09_06520, partial [Candidatus Methanodesulfokora sp.]
MRKAAMLLLVALLVGALPAAATPISMFPEPFVKAGTIYTADGKATMAIVIGDKAATFDMIGAAMLAMKIGSHLYYTNAPYVNVDDAAKHGITLYYGGFDANEYNISKTDLTLVTERVGTTVHNLSWCYTGTIVTPGYDITPPIFNVNGADCNPEGYDYVLMPLEDMKLNPAKFHYIVGEAALISDVPKLVGSGGGFYVQTGLIEFSNATGDVNIPWLGFKLHVDNIHFGTPNQIRVRMLTPDGVTVAFLNISADSDLFFFDGVTTEPNSDSKVVVVGNVKIKVGGHKGVPYFEIGTYPDWIVLPPFGVILANITTATFDQSAVTDEIADHYNAYGAEARLNSTSYPVKAWGVWNVSSSASTDNPYAYIWSSSIFPWFGGAVNAYFLTGTDTIYVFNKTYGIALWNFNETKHIGCYDFVFTSIGNRTEEGAVKCPLTETVVSKEYYCTFICGECAGVYKIETTEETVEKLHCDFMTG